VEACIRNLAALTKRNYDEATNTVLLEGPERLLKCQLVNTPSQVSQLHFCALMLASRVVYASRPGKLNKCGIVNFFASIKIQFSQSERVSMLPDEIAHLLVDERTEFEVDDDYLVSHFQNFTDERVSFNFINYVVLPLARLLLLLAEALGVLVRLHRLEV